jgi:hypothetical protein
MKTSLNPRAGVVLIAVTLLAVFWGHVPVESPPQAAAAWVQNSNFAITPDKREGDVIDPGFTNAQQNLLRQALTILYGRLLTTKVQAAFNAQGGNPWPKGNQPGTQYDQASWQKFDSWLRDNHQNILSFQMGRFRDVIFDRKTAKFPKINVGRYYAVPNGPTKEDKEYGDSLARGPYGTVFIPRDKEGKVQPPEGSFELAINAYFLGTKLQVGYDNPNYWAGVLTHEMCHNLGHGHPLAGEAHFKNRHLYQMYLLQLSVATVGNFKFGDNQDHFTCKIVM